MRQFEREGDENCIALLSFLRQFDCDEYLFKVQSFHTLFVLKNVGNNYLACQNLETRTLLARINIKK